MKVNKAAFHPDLRGIAGKLKVLNFFLSRKRWVRLLLFIGRFSQGKDIRGLHCEQRYIPSRHGGPDIRVRIYKPVNAGSRLPAMLYCHGGGYMIGSPEQYHQIYKNFTSKRPCIIVAPDYRKSPAAPYPAALHDCYDTLLWMKTNSAELGAADHSFILCGHSAGGGLCAALTLLARDKREVKIAFQMPFYPMIDDRRTSESSSFMNTPIWDAKTNELGWQWYLGDLLAEKEQIPVYAAPARNEDFRDLPPTISFVGSMEPFRDETLGYVEALKKENIPVKFRLYEGCFHAFDLLGSRSEISKDAMNFTYGSFAEFYDTYCTGTKSSAN